MTKKPEQKNTALPRPPIVAILGHVDHGKTTLLDRIRQSNVTRSEAGGITQHIGAYEIIHKTSEGKEQVITFLDTPGHEAFAGIRERGVQAADIAVLVVSAEDGVKPQTLEALKWIRKRKLPFIVAFTKIDKPAANVERAKLSLAEHEVYLEGQGGTVPFVALSGKTGEGVNDLLELIALLTEVEGIKGNANLPAEGIIIEATRSKTRGLAATLVIKNGRLKTGEVVAAGEFFAPVRSIEDFLGKRREEGLPGSAVQIFGWNEVPTIGLAFKTFPNRKEAEAFCEAEREKRKRPTAHSTTVEEQARAVLPVVVKADALGTIEAIERELKKLPSEKLEVRVIRAGAGDITESDVKTAATDKNTVIVGFNVKIDSAGKSAAERTGVTVEIFDVIYKLIERLTALSLERTPRVEVTELKGSAKILKLFSADKDRQILGGKVIEGTISLGDECKIFRRDFEIGTGRIKELQQKKLKAKDVEKDYEFGALIQSTIEIAPGDRIESFNMVTK